MTEEEKKRIEEEAAKPGAVAATQEERDEEAEEFAKDKEEIDLIQNPTVPGVDTTKAPDIKKISDEISENNTPALQNNIRDTYKGYSTGEFNGDHWFQDDSGKHRTVQDRIGNATYYRIPNSTDLLRVNSDNTFERVSQQDYENVKYEGMNKLMRKYMPAADRVRQRYEEFRDLQGRIPTQKELEALMGEDAWAWQTVYGGNKGRFNTALGGNVLFGHVNKDNANDLESQYQTALADRNRGKNTMEGALNTPDENGLYSSNKVVTKIKDSEGKERNITSEQAKAVTTLLKRWDEDKETDAETKLQKAQALLATMGIDIDVTDLYNQGGEVYGKMSTLVDALLNSDQGDNISNILAAEGVVKNSDGTYTIPAEMTFEDLQNQIKDKLEQQKLRTQTRQNERAAARVGVADLLAGVGDMIKASNGARVDVRDWSSKYEKLDEKNRNLYNVYQARQEQMRQQKAANDAAEVEFNRQVYRDTLKYNKEKELANAKNLNDLLVSENKTEAQVKTALMKYQHLSEVEATKKAKAIMAKSTKYDSTLKVGDTNWGFAKDFGAKDMYNALYSEIENIAGKYGLSSTWNNSKVKKSSGMMSEDDAMASIQRFFGAINSPELEKEVNGWLQGRAGIIENPTIHATTPTPTTDETPAQGSTYHY